VKKFTRKVQNATCPEKKGERYNAFFRARPVGEQKEQKSAFRTSSSRVGLWKLCGRRIGLQTKEKRKKKTEG